MKTKTIFEGAATALITPLTPDGIDYENFGRLIDCGDVFARWTQTDQFVQQIQILFHIGSLLMKVEIRH